MDPEVPFIIAGVVAVVGGYAKEKGWPRNGTKAVLATGALAIVASVTAGTSLAPYVTALGWLAVAGAVYGAVPNLPTRKA